MEKKAFEDSLWLTKFFLLLSGIKITKTKWGKSFERLFDYYLYYFNQSWLYTDVCGEINWLVEGILSGTSFIDLSLTAPCITISLLATSKSVFLYLNRDIIVDIVDKLRDIHPADDDFDEYAKIETENVRTCVRMDNNETDAEKEIVNDSIKFLNVVIRLQYYICAVVICAFPLMPVTSMAYDYYMTGRTECKYPYLVKYFFDPYTMKMWPAVYFHHVVSTAIVGACVFSSDSLFYTVCIYIQMHFRMLCHRCERTVAATAKETRENVAKAVKRHQELINLVDQVEILYSKSTLFNIVTSSVLICLSSFIITVLEDISVVVTFVTFLLMNLSQISLLCYFGDMLMRSSTEISSAVYNSLWYETDERTKKNMLLILIRFGQYTIILATKLSFDFKDKALEGLFYCSNFTYCYLFNCWAQKPCKLTACNFADLNLTAFTTILSRSWSYFALLKTMYN